jgi:hypothetical protein
MATYYSTYTFPTHKSGDTFLGVTFTMKDEHAAAINIAGATIILQTSSPNVQTLSVGNGITITNGAGGVFKIDEQVISWGAGNYEYEINFTFTSGRKRTYITGFWLIVD